MIDDYITLYETLESVLARLDLLVVRSDFECECCDGVIARMDDIATDVDKVLKSVKRAHWSDRLESAS